MFNSTYLNYPHLKTPPQLLHLVRLFVYFSDFIPSTPSCTMSEPQRGYLEQLLQLGVITQNQVAKTLLSDISFPVSGEEHYDNAPLHDVTPNISP